MACVFVEEKLELSVAGPVPFGGAQLARPCVRTKTTAVGLARANKSSVSHRHGVIMVAPMVQCHSASFSKRNGELNVREGACKVGQWLA